MLFKMFLLENSKKEITRHKLSQASYQVPCEDVLMLFVFLSESPDVIILLADDLGYGDLSVSGHPTSRTPNIDQLVQSSVRFNSLYSASPVCSPSRAALLTGQVRPVLAETGFFAVLDKLGHF